MSDEGRDSKTIPAKRVGNLVRDYIVYPLRSALGGAIMWVIKPHLGPMLVELDGLVRLVIQRSIQFADIYEDKQGNLRFAQGTRRYDFLNKESEEQK